LHLLTWILVTTRISAIELDVEEVPVDVNEIQIWITPCNSPQKINLKKVENFRLRKVTVNPPPFTTHFTTNSLQNNHAEHHVFSKTPCKNTYPPRWEKIQQKSCAGFAVSPGQLGARIAVN
jgi:hypothetical protein